MSAHAGRHDRRLAVADLGAFERQGPADAAAADEQRAGDLAAADENAVLDVDPVGDDIALDGARMNAEPLDAGIPDQRSRRDRRRPRTANATAARGLSDCAAFEVEAALDDGAIDADAGRRQLPARPRLQDEIAQDGRSHRPPLEVGLLAGQHAADERLLGLGQRLGLLCRAGRPASRCP